MLCDVFAPLAALRLLGMSTACAAGGLIHILLMIGIGVVMLQVIQGGGAGRCDESYEPPERTA